MSVIEFYQYLDFLNFIFLKGIMPLTSSAKKALKVEKRRKIENDATRAKLKSALKGAKIAIREGKQPKETSELITKAYSEIDKAAKKHVIHKNKAARIKSRLTKKANATAKLSQDKKK